MTVPFSFWEKGFFLLFSKLAPFFFFFFFPFLRCIFLFPHFHPSARLLQQKAGQCAKRRSLKRKRRPFFSFFANAIFSRGDFFSFPWRIEYEEGTGSGSISFFIPYTRSFAKKKNSAEKRQLPSKRVLNRVSLVAEAAVSI